MTSTGRIQVFVSTGLFFLTLALTACGSPPAGNQENGQKWFKMNNCGSCHGETGKGGRAPDITDPRMGFGGFVKKLRTQNAPIMPHYPESKISEQDAADIYAFLKNAK